MDAKQTGDKLKSLRIEKGLTQKELAKELNVSDKLISKWETGLSIPNAEFILSICTYFGIDANEFIGLKTEENKSVKSQKKLSAKAKKILICSLCAVFAVTITLLSIFVFYPLSHKDEYLAQINASIEKTFSKGYYQLTLQMQLDDKKTTIVETAKYKDGKGYYKQTKDGKVESIIIGDVKYTHVNSLSRFDSQGINSVEDLLMVESTKDFPVLDLSEELSASKVKKTSYGYDVKFEVDDFTTPTDYSIVGSPDSQFYITDGCLEKLKMSFEIKSNINDTTIHVGVVLTFDLKISEPQITFKDGRHLWVDNDVKDVEDVLNQELDVDYNKTSIVTDGQILSAGNKLVVYDESRTVKVYDGKTLDLINTFFIDHDFLSSYSYHNQATEDYLYISAPGYNLKEILQIDLSNGSYEMITCQDYSSDLPAFPYDGFYVNDDGDIYYTLGYYSSRKTMANGHLLNGHFMFENDGFIYTVDIDYRVYKYDQAGVLIETYLRTDYYLISWHSKMICAENGKFYFDELVVDENFTNYEDYFDVSQFAGLTQAFCKIGDKIICNEGIFYEDFFKIPIITLIENAYELTDYLIIQTSDDNFYSISKSELN